MTALLIIGGILVASALVVFVAARSAPEGHQDEKGFHFGHPENHHRHRERLKRREPASRH